MTLTQGTEKFSLLFCCLPDILLSVNLCVPVCAPSRRTVAAVTAVFVFRVCCVIHIPPLPSSVNYLFRLLRVRMILYSCAVGNGTWQFAMRMHSKRPCSREHGQRWNDLPSELPNGRERTCSQGVLCQRPCGFVSAETVPYRTEGKSTRVKLSFYYYLEKNRKIGRSQIVNFL